MPIDALPPQIGHAAPHNEAAPTTYNVGAHIVEGFAGTEPDDAGVRALQARAEAGRVGGAILFGYNVESPEQLRRLGRAIAQWQVPAANRPFLLMVDQEGGAVQRLSHTKGFGDHPCARELGAMTPQDRNDAASALAYELADCAINVNLAPVCDLACSPASIVAAKGRSYGPDCNGVVAAATSFVDAHRRAHVATVLKHFPGLGSATGDTHEGLIDATSVWSAGERLPFAQLIATGHADAVMGTHVVQRHAEPSGMPLTFSRRVMHDWLRRELGFDGLLITDDLGMGAVQRHYSLEQTVQLALNSSHDILLFGQNEAALGGGRPARHAPISDLFERVQSAIQQSLADGTLTEKELQRSDRRLELFRAKVAR